MAPVNLIVNGDFEAGSANWTGNQIETAKEHNYLVGGDSGDRVAELDGSVGTTVMQQQFTLNASGTAELSFEVELRQVNQAIENQDGFKVEVISVADGSTVYSSGDVFPADNGATSTTTGNFSATITYPAAGDYILRFTEITLSGGHDGRGVIIDDVEMLICFVRGTMIETSKGEVPIENLGVDDLVKCLHGGFRPIRWMNSTKVSATGKLCPVRILAGALGQNLPTRDLLVSRQHRMMVSSKIAERMFAQRDVLIPAIKLTEMSGIFVDEGQSEVEYFHLLFDEHEVIFANGAPSESLYRGPQALKAMSPEAREELLTLFPEMFEEGAADTSVLPIPSLKHQKNLVGRHIRNNRMVLESFAPATGPAV